MIRTAYSTLAVMLLTGGFYSPSVVFPAPAQAVGIHIDLGIGPYVWGPREYRHFKRWQKLRNWKHRRWEDLRDAERREYWKWRHPPPRNRHHRGRW